MAVVALLVCGCVVALPMLAGKYDGIVDMRHIMIADPANLVLALSLMAAAACFIEAFCAIAFRLIRGLVFRARG